MELTNDFSVPVPKSRAWEVLTDVELIAPCLPGAQLQEIEGNEYRGIVKVKVGPITAQYKGAAVFVEQDEAAGKIVIDASGRDTRGQGSASAVITVTMSEADGRTEVSVNSDVTIKGKVAQFGRGMISDVSAKLLTQFVECLEGKLEAEPAGAPAAPEVPADPEVPAAVSPPPAAAAAADGVRSSAAAPTAAAPSAKADVDAPASTPAMPATPEPSKVRKINQPASEPVDLLEAAGAPVAQRLIPVVVVVLLLILIGRRRSRRRG